MNHIILGTILDDIHAGGCIDCIFRNVLESDPICAATPDMRMHCMSENLVYVLKHRLSDQVIESTELVNWAKNRKTNS